MKAIARTNSQTIDSLQQKLEQSFKETSTLETETHELEEQVQNLLATTVRQTTVIEECDRVLSETKAKQQQTRRNYEEQLQLTSQLNAKIQRLEVKVVSMKQSKESETVELERKVSLLENTLAEHQSQLLAAEEALQSKNKEIDVMQRAYITRDNNRHNVDEVSHSSHYG
ncbi:Hypothetical protein PHPALM_2104 [Phytophthora palmivora]|uniref:Uncharacterized protein n=1 Tax=Phytophthora palmivora TaxID=4796 RepID=A0A2P4YQM1_9STRA|nr:Hypothetical protein PHPALM_2104 [Phytophthora palmivora]